ncbi:MAG TPA: branched-chain amino acid ABC transporter permease, partial [Desulfobacter sp.]|nr:branched-chain amino acid ABC transporter permease [Desulfobacter sp.]
MTGKPMTGTGENSALYETDAAFLDRSALARQVVKDTINKVLLGAVVILVLALPALISSPTWLHIIVLIFFYAYLTTSWNMVGGFAGVLPLGHAVFLGIGAYTSTVLSLQYGISPWL